MSSDALRNVLSLRRLGCRVLLVPGLLILLGNSAFAQEEIEAEPWLENLGGGFYFAWWKIGMILIVFWAWAKMADWISRDAEMVQHKTEMKGFIWNPIVLAAFLMGLLVVLFMPFFILGYPFYLVCAILPFFIYTKMRNKHFEGSARVFSKAHRQKIKEMKDLPEGTQYVESTATLQQDMGPQVDFSASGADNTTRQRNLILARQNPAFLTVKDLIADAVYKRAEIIRMDFTREMVTLHYQIDGIWQPMPPLDRMMGDAMLVALKQIADLKPEDRRSKQSGQFDFKVPDRSMRMKVNTQGTKTGELAMFTVIDRKAAKLSLTELGMRQEMRVRLHTFLHQPGYPLVSAMPGDGLSSTWNAVVESIDRVTRELVGLVKADNDERDVENVTYYDVGDGSGVMKKVADLLLKEPDGFIVPDPISGELIDKLSNLTLDDQAPKFAISHVRARSATEALLRMLKFKCDRQLYADAVPAVLCQRLVRRLCETCKQPYQASPDLVKRLGANPNEPLILYREYQPTPEELVDDKGQPVEPPICPACSGMGYIGRFAVYELLDVNSRIRKALVSKPKLESLDLAARKSGHKTIQQEGILAVIDGLTSLTELQRVLKS